MFNNKFKTCFECRQECCRSVIVETEPPTIWKDWDDIKWQVAHKNVNVLLDNENSWCVEFLTDCTHLADNGRCMIYDTRPDVCRNYSPFTCVVNGEGEYYKIIFRSIKDVEKYLKEHPEAIEEEEEEEDV